MKENAEKNFILIPKIAFWTVVTTLVIALIGSYIYTQINFVRIEKNLEIYQISSSNDVQLLKVQVTKDLEILSRMERKLDNINQNQIDMEKKLILKQDKKFNE